MEADAESAHMQRQRQSTNTSPHSAPPPPYPPIPTLTVASLNVLAHCYTDPFRKRTQASASPTAKLTADIYLEWSLRSKRLARVVKELVEEHFVDIFCLQEVDEYDTFYAALLDALGFDHAYYQRPSRSDGLVVAWRRERLKLVGKTEVDFDRIEGLPPNGRKHNVALLCMLQEKDSALQRKFLVGNTHLHWNPSRRLLKLMQASHLMQVISATVQRHQGSTQRGDKSLPCLLCGDFNSLPESPVIQLVR